MSAAKMGTPKATGIMCSILRSPHLWAGIAAWEIVKMVLMVVARYHSHITRPRVLCTPTAGSVLRGILFSVLMLQCYISTAVWLALLFLYFHKLNCGEVWQLVLIFVESLMNAIFSFTGIYFNIKNRPHHILSKDEAKEMFKRLVDAVPEVKFQLYSFNSLLPKYEEALEPSSWLDHTQENNSPSFNYFQLEHLLDSDSEFVALLRLEVKPYDQDKEGEEVRPFDDKEAEEYKMVLYRFAERCSFHLSDIQILSIVEDTVPAMSIALTSHHSTRIHIVGESCQKQNSVLWVLANILCPYLGTYRNWQLKDQCIRLSVLKTFK